MPSNKHTVSRTSLATDGTKSVRPVQRRTSGAYRVIPNSMPLKQTRPVMIDNQTIGEGGFSFISGSALPLSAEGVIEVGAALESLGLKFFRAPIHSAVSRSGDRKLNTMGLKLLRAACDKFNLLAVGEVFSETEVRLVANQCDVLEIPAQYASRPKLVSAAADTGRLLILHRPGTHRDFLQLVRLAEKKGAAALILADNGSRIDGQSTSALDLSALIDLQRETSHPVLLNVESVVSDWSYVEHTVCSAVSMGVDGAIINLCYQPEIKVQENRKNLAPATFTRVIRRAVALNATVRALNCSAQLS